jgi:hypothetical protein
MPQKLTAEIINAAIAGFEQQKVHIDSQIAELRAMLPGGTAQDGSKPETITPKRKKFSAAARRKMALAQKARWQRIRGGLAPAPAAGAPSPALQKKRRISPKGLKNIIAATKKRWALKRAAEAAAAKKTAPARKKSAAKKAAANTPSVKAA